MDHTTNYNLPLYTAQDETNYMTNWNGAMTSIDTAIKNSVDTTSSELENLSNKIDEYKEAITIGNNVQQIADVVPNNHEVTINFASVGLYAIYAVEESGEFQLYVGGQQKPIASSSKYNDNLNVINILIPISKPVTIIFQGTVNFNSSFKVFKID